VAKDPIARITKWVSLRKLSWAEKILMSEQDIRSKFITPAIVKGGWDLFAQIREEVTFTQGKVIVRGKLVSRGKAKRADYILYYKPKIPNYYPYL
jgi:type I restriction enzyme R subunit